MTVDRGSGARDANNVGDTGSEAIAQRFADQQETNVSSRRDSAAIHIEPPRQEGIDGSLEAISEPRVPTRAVGIVPVEPRDHPVDSVSADQSRRLFDVNADLAGAGRTAPSQDVHHAVDGISRIPGGEPNSCLSELEREVISEGDRVAQGRGEVQENTPDPDERGVLNGAVLGAHRRCEAGSKRKGGIPDSHENFLEAGEVLSSPLAAGAQAGIGPEPPIEHLNNALQLLKSLVDDFEARGDDPGVVWTVEDEGEFVAAAAERIKAAIAQLTPAPMEPLSAVVLPVALEDEPAQEIDVDAMLAGMRKRYHELGDERLQLRMEAGGGRHYIGEVALHCGDPMTAQIDGQWYDGRYEASWHNGLPDAVFYYVNDAGEKRAKCLDEMSWVRVVGVRFTP
jgi:hypothetical protein